MKTIIDRLEEYMSFKGLNDNKITVQANLSNSLIGKARKKRNGLHSDTIENILTTFKDLNPAWFILGVGEMILNEHTQVNLYGVSVKPNRQDSVKEPDIKYKTPSNDYLIQTLKEKDNKIIELALRCGSLEAKNEELTKRLEEILTARTKNI